MPSTKEIEAIKRKLRKEAAEDHRKRTSSAGLAKYERKSNAKAKKGNKSKARGRDVYTNMTRLPGSGFSRQG